MLSLENINTSGYNSQRYEISGYVPIHRIVFVRHGETIANNMLLSKENIDHITLNTELTELGYLQAQNIGIFFKEINFKPDNIICSSLKRTYDTAEPTINIFPNVNVQITKNWREYNKKKTELVCDKNYDVWSYEKETHLEFVKRVFDLFGKLKTFGTREQPMQTIVFTHSQVISAILIHCLTNSTEPILNSNGFFHLSNGSITCIDIDEKYNSHVHTVNYTKHLDNPTGQHTPFV